jgi:hypothetical protein
MNKPSMRREINLGPLESWKSEHFWPLQGVKKSGIGL